MSQKNWATLIFAMSLVSNDQFFDNFSPLQPGMICAHTRNKIRHLTLTAVLHCLTKKLYSKYQHFLYIFTIKY